MIHEIPLSYNPIDIDALTRVLSAYQDKHHNSLIADFEAAVTDLTGLHAIAMNSGTACIHLAMKILGVGKNDTILAPSFTYIATVNPALYLGAKPVFIDSKSDTWNMDPDLLENALQDLDSHGVKPKAIIIVHTYGMPSDLVEITKIAEKYDVPLIEDAAESFGSVFNECQTGTFGRIGVYSFNNNKLFTTYGGGALLTKDQDLAQKARFFASQARENEPYYQFRESGFNYLMSPLNAAYGLSQLHTLPLNIEKRRGIFENYKAALSDLTVEFQLEKPKMRSNRWFSTILVKNQTLRENLEKALSAQRIETRPVWRPMHSQPLFKGTKSYVNGVADKLFERGLCLPSSSALQPSDQYKIIDVIRQVTSRGSARI